MSRSLLIILALVVLLRAPFLYQPIQGDDVYYLAGAEYAQTDPLHPSHARYLFQGDLVDMRGHPHPPLNAWVLAALIAVIGDVREPLFHAAYIAFSLIAAVSMWSLAKRFTARPMLATLLFIATPAFVVNGTSLEADLPFLAFWMASIALFVSDRLVASALVMALASMTAYQAVVLTPILACYVWLHARTNRWAWAVTLAPVATIGAWQLYERLTSGALPATVLAGYFSAYGLQQLARKLANAAALTAHSGWLVFPPLIVAAFWRNWRWVALPAIALAFVDPHPLFWASAAIGLLALLPLRKGDTPFLTAWIVVFFAAALVIFFAGSARYLLPIAAPVAMLVTRALDTRPRWLAAGFAAQMVLSLGLAWANYDQWNGYRRFAESINSELASRRTWSNAEWGLRFYAESAGAMPLARGQAVRPGDLVVSSQLALPIPYTAGGGAPVRLAQTEIRPVLPLRLIALDSRSAWSTAMRGFRPFDISRAPVDRVRADLIVERKPVSSWLEMGAPEADSQIVSGVYQVENNAWRWMGGRAALLLKPPGAPAPLHVVLFAPELSPVRRVKLRIDGAAVADEPIAGPGKHELVTRSPVSAAADPVLVEIEADKTFSVPGDGRRLSLILVSAGFR